MGFYDFRCAVTGISLRGIDAVLVGLRPVGDRYRPLTLGIAGKYNRLGSIDRIEEDPTPIWSRNTFTAAHGPVTS